MQIVAALDHACHRDVTHRDIKPSNILLTPEGRAKLVDMGLARLHIAGEQDLTVSGITLGTFDYISEQARDQDQPTFEVISTRSGAQCSSWWLAEHRLLREPWCKNCCSISRKCR